jgi:hypothetical protein
MQQFDGSMNEQEDYSENYEENQYGEEYDEENIELQDYDVEGSSPNIKEPYKGTSEKKSQPSSGSGQDFNKGSTLGKRGEDSSAKENP